MGRPPYKEPEDKTYKIENLWEHHYEILRRLALGEQPKVIAEALGITPQTVSNARTSVIGKEVLKKLSGERDEVVENAQEILNLAAPQAAKVMAECVADGLANGAKVGEVLRAAEGILDRTGFPKTTINKNLETSDNRLSLDELEALKERAKAIRMTKNVTGVFGPQPELIPATGV